MGRYLKEARYHVERVRYYYKHGGDTGYSQATHHYSELADLALRAERSKNDKNDVVVILALRESVGELMNEIEKYAADRD